LLRDEEDLRVHARDAGGLNINQLRLGAFISSTTTLLPAVIEALARRWPDVSVYIDAGYSPDLSSKVAAGELDAAIVVQHQFDMPKSCEWHPMVTAPLIVIAPDAVAQGVDPHELLRTAPFIRYDRLAWGGRIADRYLRECGIKPKVRVEIDGMTAIATMVSKGLGISLLPDWSSMWPSHLRLRRLPLPSSMPSRSIGLVRGVSSPRRHLLDALQANLQEMLRQGVRPGDSAVRRPQRVKGTV
jgi:DNA-binding transcriptional LysR family regulator